MELIKESVNEAKNHLIMVRIGHGISLLLLSILFIVLGGSGLIMEKVYPHTMTPAMIFYSLMVMTFVIMVVIVIIRNYAIDAYNQKLVYEGAGVIREISPKVTSGQRLVTIEAENQIYAIEKTDEEVEKFQHGDAVRLVLNLSRTPYDVPQMRYYIDKEGCNKKKLPIDEIEIKEKIDIKPL